MLNERQTMLLKYIVEDYIKTARPVSSKSISELLDCSSATIRNEMSFLEDVGLLEKTHISSGRVPSEAGYRYYVDNIMVPRELTGEEMLRLSGIFRNNSLVLTDAISKSMEIISELTNYTAIILGSNSKENRLSRVEVVPLSSSNMLAIIITDTGHVEHRNLVINEDISLTEIQKTVDLINKLIVGTPILEVSSKLEFEVKPIIQKMVKQHEILYNAFYNAFNTFATKPDIQMSGTSNILMNPEFNDATRIREIVSKFEDKASVRKIAREEDGTHIYIGSETEFDDDVTIVKTKYNANGIEGTIAVIGPKRMEYDRVITLLDFIKDNIER